MGNVTPHVDPLITKLINRDALILISLSKERFLVQSVVSLEALRLDPEKVNIVSYRWNVNAIAFQQQFNWRDAFRDLRAKGEALIPVPKKTHASKFYSDIIKIIERIGKKYLWIDQLSIPQDQGDLTMQIVLSSGVFYQQFNVFVWVPWATISDEEIQLRISVLGCNDYNEKRAKGVLKKIEKEMSALYEQLNRGWILRETNPFCRVNGLEWKRNARYL